jgi:glycosyltransferase involved in cell wall biosynthesis
VSALISVVLIGHADQDAGDRLRISVYSESRRADDFSVRVLADDRDIPAVLAESPAHVIFTFGDVASFPVLHGSPLEIRRRWTHFDDPQTDLGELALRALNSFVDVATNDRFPDEPLVSVFTPTYRTGNRILRPYKSLVEQTYTNWEWVLYDDSPDDDDTIDLLSSLRASDPRVQLFFSDIPSGRIGEVKRRLCGLARGSILVELDHDDELTPNCLADIVEAFRTFPEAGFAYTDCAEIYESGLNATYGETYAFGFGSYRAETFRGHTYMVCNYPSINAKTVRHIVGMPNHARAWRASAYFAAGGHNPEIHVADDYELCIRTFLTTPMVHIQRFGYIQYLGDGGENTQRTRNREIQRLVAAFADRYEPEIHRRFEELGVPDFIHTDQGLDWELEPPGTGFIANLVLR